MKMKQKNYLSYIASTLLLHIPSALNLPEDWHIML